MEGEAYFDMLKTYFTHCVDTLTVMISLKPAESSVQGAHALQREEDSDSDESLKVYTASFSKDKGATPWWQGKKKFPCPLDGHQNHEIATCSEFLGMKAKDRRINSGQRQLCWTCLRPRIHCAQVCNVQHLVPKELKCQGCTPYALKRNLAPLNILMCSKDAHDDDKPMPSVVIKELRKYLAVSSLPVQEPDIRYKVHLVQALQVTPEARGTSQWKRSIKNKRRNKTSLGISTQSGRTKPIRTDQIYPAPVEPPLFLTQWIRIGNKKLLVLFDKGANTNLLSSRITSENGVEKCSGNPGLVGGIGGDGTIPTSGEYKIILQAYDSEWHEVRCLGIQSMTRDLPEIHLGEVLAELEDTKLIPRGTPLPAKAGGGCVDMIIGVSSIAFKLRGVSQAGVPHKRLQ